MEIPSWISEQFWRTILEKCEDEKPNNEAISFTTQPANPLAANLLTDTFRVQVKYRTKQGIDCFKDFIVKCPDMNKEVTQDLAKLDFYSREPMAYEMLFPQMYKKKQETFSPKFYPCAIKDALVLEDLGKDGYVSCNPQKRLDFIHCKEVLIKIAKFHATSVSCYNENPNVFDNFSTHVIFTHESPSTKGTEAIIKLSLSCMIETLTQSQELDSFRKFLLERVDKVWEGVTESCKKKTVGLNVLNHGDLWTSNILFKYDSAGRKIDHVNLIDYQLTHFSTPVNDLMWFLWTSAEEEVFENHLENLKNIYFETLNTTLELLGCEQKLTKQEFENDIKAAIDYVLMIISHQLPIFMGMGLSEVNEELVQKEKTVKKHDTAEHVFEKYYKGKYYSSILPSVCRQFEKHFL